jgi:hypothetical protein
VASVPRACQALASTQVFFGADDPVLKKKFIKPRATRPILHLVLLKFEWVSFCHIDQLLSVN